MPRTSPWREDPVELDPGAPVLASSGAAPPWELLLRRAAPPPMRPFPLNRPISNGRPRLDLGLSHPEPLDPDPAVWIHAYRFGRYFC